MVDNKNTYSERVSRLVNWGHWFAFFNIVASMLIATRYISKSPWPETLLGQAYLVTSWLGHFSFLVFALYLLTLFPLTFIIPSKKLYRFVAACFSTIGLTLLLLDTQAYQQINLHLNPVVWELLLEKDQSNIATELQQLFIILPITFLLQIALSEWIWSKQRKLSHKRIGRPISQLFFVCFIASHLVYIWADISFYKPITDQKANFPLSYPMTARTFMQKHGLVDTQEYNKRRQENDKLTKAIAYPIEPPKYRNRIEDYNIVMVMVSSLRADAVNPRTMPNLSHFASQSLNFTNHYSSDNDAGSLFGLFYGIPTNYKKSVVSQNLPPVVLQTMIMNDYKFGLFSSEKSRALGLRDSIFAFTSSSFNQAQDTEDSTTIENWIAWLEEQKNTDSPWFSYIDLSTVHNYEALIKDTPNVNASPKQKLQNAYAEATLKVDSLLEKVFHTLHQQALTENTIVIVTSDHGVEFNETNTNSWGAGSNYSRYQLNVPLIIHWPNKEAKQYHHTTSHFDLSVTLMQDLFDTYSSPLDYSSGKNVLDTSSRRWTLAGDGRNIALVTDQYTTVVDMYGNYKVYDENYKRQKDSKAKLSILMLGLSELKRFYESEQYR